MSPAPFKPSGPRGFTPLRKLRRGFTMIELIVVVSIFTISMAATMPFLGSFQRTETLETHTQDLVQVLRRAQHRAVTGERGLAWGVRTQTGAFILFAGDSYDTRSTQFDETHTIKSVFTFSGSGEIVFSRATGVPAQGAASVMLTSESEQSQVTVGPSGSITRSGFGT